MTCRPAAFLRAALLAVVAAAPLRGQAASPPGPAAGRVAEIVAVMSGGDPQATRTWLTANLTPEFLAETPMEEHLQIWGEIYDRHGGFDVQGVEATNPHEATATLKDHRTGEWLTLLVRVEPEPPHRVAGLALRMAPPPAGLGASRAIDDAEFARRLEASVDSLVRADVFSGVVLVARDGEVIFHRAYGEASKSWNAPNLSDTKFNLGSMNKMFTAVAIGQLAEAGRLRYDDPIGKYLGEEWVRPEVGAKVQIRHLLSHTSGLGSYFTPEFMNASRLNFRNVDDYRPIVSRDSLAFDPGTDWSYSNTGFLLLGAIIEEVTGESYYDYVREHVFEPAGMTDTDSYEMDLDVPNLAIGYSRETSGESVVWRNNILEHVVKGGPAGGGYSTAPDLMKFAEALRSGRLVSPETFKLLTTPKPDLGSPEYGYGFGIAEGGDSVGHTGGFPGISSAIDIYLDGTTVVVLSNYDRGAPPVRNRIRQTLPAR